jgi:competence protein CoiA
MPLSKWRSAGPIFILAKMESVKVSVRIAPVYCWSCGAEFHIVPSVELATDGESVECSVSDFTAYPHLVAAIQASLPGELKVGALKARHSQMRGRSYISNGCFHCDALFGDHYEIHARYDEEVAAVFEGVPSKDWREMARALMESEDNHLI